MKLLRGFAILAGTAACALAQHPAGSLLIVETANHTAYVYDVADHSLLATRSGPTTPVIPRNFAQEVLIGDIVSINGRRVKGTVFEMVTDVFLRPQAAAGQAIADITRGAMTEWYFEILHEDGQLVGSIRVSGMTGGPPPPGQTREIRQASFVVVGGNGAFLGARGYMGAVGPAGAPRRDASITEDPANRRLHGGGSIQQGIYLLPMSTPEIVTTAGGPAVVHASDYSPITTARPARAGEVLALFASGLGPTRPAPEPGQAFSANPLPVVNSPVEVIVNGTPGEVLYAGGYPGAIDRYQVNFRMPDGVSGGVASVHLTSAWIAGSVVRIPIQ